MPRFRIRRPRRTTFAAVVLALLAARAPSAPAADPAARALAEQRARAEAASHDPRVWNDFGNLLALAGDAAGAEAAYRRALEIDAASGTARYNLGRLLLETGRERAARRELRRAVELDPTHAAAHYYLGAAYDAANSARRARRAYRRAFALDPLLADPARNPHVAGSRQALAAQLQAWMTEPPLSPPRRDEPATRLAAPAQLPPRGADTTTASASAGGGVVRSVSGAPAAASAESPTPLRSDGEATAEPERRPAPRSTKPVASIGVVLGAGDLRSNRVVNQAGGGAEGASPGTSRAAPRSRATPPGRTGRPSPFAPPPVTPFVPQPDSTGRFETVLEAVPDGAAAGS
jgi:hypothetical protein